MWTFFRRTNKGSGKMWNGISRRVNDSCSRMYFYGTCYIYMRRDRALSVCWGYGQTAKERKWGFPRKFVTKDNSTVRNIIFHSDDFTVIEFGNVEWVFSGKIGPENALFARTRFRARIRYSSCCSTYLIHP